MAVISYLLDTDVIIDWLRGQTWTEPLIWSSSGRPYCSNVTRKELLSRPNLPYRERQSIERLLRHVRVLNVDSVIAAAASELLQRYIEHPLTVNDALIAATAWVKHLPLLTRNRKHYDFIIEIDLPDPLSFELP